MSTRTAPRVPIAPAPIPQAQDGSRPLPPNPQHDIIAQINASGNVSSDDGALTIIHVVPDHRFMLISWIYSIQHAIPASAYAASPHASPASLLGYCLMMFSGLMLFNDLCLAPSPSAAAQTIFNDSVYNMFFNVLLDMPVPQFAENEFLGNQYFNDALAQNLVFCPDYSGMRFLYDFGRFFPSAMFFRLHNMMARLPANTAPANLLRSFYRDICSQVNFGTAAAPNNIDVTPNMFLGSVLNGVRYGNWLNRRVEQLVNGLAIRPVFTAPTVAALPLHMTARATNDNFNGYLFMSGLSHDNIDSLLQIARSIGNFVKETFPGSLPLRNYTQAGSCESVRHLIFKAAIPTWSTEGTRVTDDAAGLALFDPAANLASHNEYATQINYLIARPPVPAPDGANASRINEVLRAPAAPDANTFGFQVIEVAAPPANTADPVNWLVNSAARSFATPRCIIFDPLESNPSGLARVIISGHIIEGNDTSAVLIPLADPEISLHVTNATFILGSFPASSLVNALTVNSPTYVEDPILYDWTTIPQMIIRGFTTALRIPWLRQGRIELIDPAQPATFNVFPGADYARHARRAHDAINVYGYQLGNTNRVPNETLTYWSSYRYYDQVRRVWTVIPSLRPIYGTRARHFGSNHPALRIP